MIYVQHGFPCLSHRNRLRGPEGLFIERRDLNNEAGISNLFHAFQNQSMVAELDSRSGCGRFHQRDWDQLSYGWHRYLCKIKDKDSTPRPKEESV